MDGQLLGDVIFASRFENGLPFLAGWSLTVESTKGLSLLFFRIQMMTSLRDKERD